ncbi:MAG: exo-alpha-sialidase [Candidatus Kapabacteria bacterium]|nr:exo-alpha-sialidase [Candidatus Kapabacteria bacterium]
MQRSSNLGFAVSFVIMLLLLVSVSVVIGYAQHGIDANWSAQLAIAKSAPTVSADGAVANNTIVQKDGTILIFYTETSGSRRTPYYVGSRDNGKTWNAPAPTIFTPPTRTTGFNSVAVDSDTEGNIHAIWGARAPLAVFYARWDAKTQRWSDTVRIAQIKRKMGFGNVTTDRKGRVHAFWHDGENGTSETAEIMHARSENSGLAWSPQVMISTDDGRHSAFPIADYSGATGDNFAIAWRDSVSRGTGGTQNWDLQISTTRDGGKTWSAPRVLIGNADYESDPNLIVGKDGRMYIAFHIYQAGNPFNARVMYGYSTDGGNTWLPQGFRQISETNIRSHLVKEAYDFANDRPWFFWKDERDLAQNMGGTMPTGDGRGADLMGAYISNRGETISKPEFLTDAGMDEVGLHNFKIGEDALPRAHYFIKQNDVTTLYYTQRKAVTTGITSVAHGAQHESAVRVAPNPAQNLVIVKFTLTKAERVSLKIFNTLGQEVAQILDAEMSAGVHEQSLEMSHWSLGNALYLFRLQTPTLFHTIPVQVIR